MLLMSAAVIVIGREQMSENQISDFVPTFPSFSASANDVCLPGCIAHSISAVHVNI